MYRGAARASGQSRGWAEALLVSCLLIPWVNPFADGPSTWIAPWLVSVMCGAAACTIARPGLPARPVTAALIALAAWPLLRSGWAPETVALAGAALLVWLSAALTSDRATQGDRTHMVALVWFAAAVISTFAALLQYFGLADPLAPWVSTPTAVGEAFANLRQRNQFATLTVMGMAALLFWRGGLKRWHAGGAVAWLGLGNAVTTSRAGLLEMVVLGVLACVWPGPRAERARLWLLGLLSYGVAAVALPWLLAASTGANAPHLWSRIADSDACGSRVVLWSNVLHLISLKPWLGWGWGELDFAHYATLYSGPRFCDILDNAHDLPLHVAVELGVPAALAICGGLVWAALRAKPWRDDDPSRQLAWAVLAALGVHSLFEYPLWYGPFQIALGLCLGLLCQAPRKSASAPGGTHDRWPAAGLASLALALALYATWDYHRVSQIYLSPDNRSPAWRDDPLPRIRDSWLFANQVRFAELTITPLTLENAAWSYAMASALLHYSPEPRVIEKLIESAVMLGRSDEAVLHLARFRAAFPKDYAKWRQSGAQAP